MANDATKIVVGSPKVGGYAFSLDVGSTLPDDATTALAVGARNLGYVSEDGVGRSTEVSTEDVLDWNRDVVRVVQTDSSAEFTLTLLELNENSLKEVYGEDNVVATATSLDYSYDGQLLPHRSYIFELKDGDRTGRIVIEDGQITNVGDVSYTKSAAIGHEVTIKCFRGPSNKFFHHYTEWPAVTP